MFLSPQAVPVMYLNCSHQVPQPVFGFREQKSSYRKREKREIERVFFVQSSTPKKERERDEKKESNSPSRRSQNEKALAVMPFIVRPVQAREQASGVEI